MARTVSNNVEEVPIELKVEYKRINTFLSDYAKNISRDTTFIKTKNPLPPGTKFVFRIVVPEMEEDLLIEGHVEKAVSDKDASRDQSPGMHIRFEYTEEADRDALRIRVGSLINASLGDRLGERIQRHIEDKARAAEA